MTENQLKLIINKIVKSEIDKLEERISSKLANIIAESVATAYTTVSAINKSMNTSNIRESAPAYSRIADDNNPIKSILSATKPFSAREQYGESPTPTILEMIDGRDDTTFETIDAMPSVVLDINDRPVSTSNPNVSKVLDVLKNTNFKHTLDVMNRAAKQHRGG